MNNIKIITIVILLVYFISLLLISMRNSRKVNQSSTEGADTDYFLAGRSLPFWALGMTFVASWIGAGAVIASSNAIHDNGISGFWVQFAPGLISVLIITIFAKAIRGLGSFSQGEMMKNRYSEIVGLLLSGVTILVMIAGAASQIIAAGQFFCNYFNTGFVVTCFVVMVVTAIYSALGGFRAVVYTDMVQFFLLIAGVFILMVAALKGIGGIGNLYNTQIIETRPDFYNIFFDFKTNFFYVLSFSIAWMISADVWQRISAAKNIEEARKVTSFTFFAFIPIYVMVIITGIAGAILYPNLAAGQSVLTSIANNNMSGWLSSVVVLGVGAAIMSTLSTVINTGALYFANDLFPKFHNNATKKETALAGVISTIVISLLGFLVAIKLPNLLQVLWMSSDILACGVAIPLLLGFLWRRGNTTGAIIGMGLGTTFVVYNAFVDFGVSLPTFWPGYPTRTLVGFTIAAIGYVVGSLITEPEYEKADKYVKAANLVKIKGPNSTKMD